jgi:polysaccharide export outer membrane protein
MNPCFVLESDSPAVTRSSSGAWSAWRSALGYVVAVALLAQTAACGGRAYIWIQDLPTVSNPGDGVIHARDTIVVAVRDQPTLSGEFVVRDDGGLLLPTVGDVVAEGRTPADIAVELKARLKDMVVNATVTVSLSHVATIRVSVIGELKTPGSYELNRDRSVAAALAAAGWLGDFAARDRIFVVRRGPKDLSVRFGIADVTNPGPNAARFRLRDGDVVVVE